MRRVAVVAFVLFVTACTHAAPATGPEPVPPAACAALDADACGEREDCAVVDGQRESGEGCLLEAEAVGCMAADTACPAVVSYAMDAEQGGWWFTSGCVPEGFEVTIAPESESYPPPGC